jgi:allantoin racemase
VKKDIRLITPIITKGMRNLDEVAPFSRPDLTFSMVQLDHGPPSIECEFDEALCIPDTIRRALEAEREGVSAIIIDCMGDPGLRACREAVSVPVLGPCEVSMHLATMLGECFTVVTTMDCSKPMLVNNAKLYNVAQRMARVRAVNVPVLDIQKDITMLQRRMAEEAERAVREDGADVIVLGCTGFLGLATKIREHLLATFKVTIPVIDPIPATVLAAAAVVDAGLTHSKKTYGTPAVKRNIGYEMPPFRQPGSPAI